MKENKKIVAHYCRLIINPDDRFEITKKGKAYLRNEEAEEYADNNFYDLTEEVQEIAKVAFKDGAEFGYNKAKEKQRNGIM